MILRPQRNFTVVRQLANHTDSSTYYVRAVIRDAYTDAILDTLDLTDRGEQRFSKNWQVVADPSGLGREISIVTSVYTDSGYTIKSENYGDEENSHLIEENNPIGRGGGSGVDARTVRRILKEELEALEEVKASAKKKQDEELGAVEPEKKEPMRFDEVLEALTSLQKAVVALSEKEPEKFDYKPFNEGVKSILSAVNEKEVTPVTDLEPVTKAIEETQQLSEAAKQEIMEVLEKHSEILSQTLPNQILEMMKGTTFGITLTPTVAKQPEGVKEVEKEKEPEPPDISSIAD